MKQLYYAIQTILHGRGSNVTKVISLSLGLTVGILLFSQIAFELSYEKCYPEAGNLGIVRAYYHNLETGESMGDDGDIYDYSVFAPIAAALAENMPGEVEKATCINSYTATVIIIMKINYCRMTNSVLWWILVFSKPLAFRF